MLFCVVLLAHFAYKFQDYNLINNTLLMQIQRQNLELKGYFESMGESPYTCIHQLLKSTLNKLCLVQVA